MTNLDNLSKDPRVTVRRGGQPDASSWRRFAAAEARRIMATFKIQPGGGLEALERALSLRLYAVINSQRTEWSDDHKQLRFFMDVCRVQEARRRKGLPDFPCKRVGLVEFETFSATVDPRIRTICLHCPPDAPGQYCGWEFRIEQWAPTTVPLSHQCE